MSIARNTTPGLEWKEVEKPDGYSGEWARKLQSVDPPDYCMK